MLTQVLYNLFVADDIGALKAKKEYGDDILTISLSSDDPYDGDKQFEYSEEIVEEIIGLYSARRVVLFGQPATRAAYWILNRFHHLSNHDIFALLTSKSLMLTDEDIEDLGLPDRKDLENYAGVNQHTVEAVVIEGDEKVEKPSENSEAEKVVELCYLEALKRAVDDSGRAAYVPLVAKGKLTKDGLITILRSSKEYEQRFRFLPQGHRRPQQQPKTNQFGKKQTKPLNTQPVKDSKPITEDDLLL